jgi:hypothetical protein
MCIDFVFYIVAKVLRIVRIQTMIVATERL